MAGLCRFSFQRTETVNMRVPKHTMLSTATIIRSKFMTKYFYFMPLSQHLNLFFHTLVSNSVSIVTYLAYFFFSFVGVWLTNEYCVLSSVQRHDMCTSLCVCVCTWPCHSKHVRPEHKLHVGPCFPPSATYTRLASLFLHPASPMSTDLKDAQSRTLLYVLWGFELWSSHL